MEAHIGDEDDEGGTSGVYDDDDEIWNSPKLQKNIPLLGGDNVSAAGGGTQPFPRSGDNVSAAEGTEPHSQGRSNNPNASDSADHALRANEGSVDGLRPMPMPRSRRGDHCSGRSMAKGSQSPAPASTSGGMAKGSENPAPASTASKTPQTDAAPSARPPVEFNTAAPRQIDIVPRSEDNVFAAGDQQRTNDTALPSEDNVFAKGARQRTTQMFSIGGSDSDSDATINVPDQYTEEAEIRNRQLKRLSASQADESYAPARRRKQSYSPMSRSCGSTPQETGR